MIIVMEMKAKSNISSINQRKGEMNDEKSVNPFALKCGVYLMEICLNKLENCNPLSLDMWCVFNIQWKFALDRVAFGKLEFYNFL